MQQTLREWSWRDFLFTTERQYPLQTNHRTDIRDNENARMAAHPTELARAGAVER